MEDNMFEWHVNLRPIDGVYSKVNLHLVITFPELSPMSKVHIIIVYIYVYVYWSSRDYPHMPPAIRVCTAIAHPNVFGGYLCLSMLRRETSTVPYEGWSSTYSVTSLLMQLQTFLFAEKVDQDGGYQARARLHDRDVAYSIDECKKFVCATCKHCHATPYPKVYDPRKYLIHTKPLAPQVTVHGSAAQTTHTYWYICTMYDVLCTMYDVSWK